IFSYTQCVADLLVGAALFYYCMCAFLVAHVVMSFFNLGFKIKLTSQLSGPFSKAMGELVENFVLLICFDTMVLIMSSFAWVPELYKKIDGEMYNQCPIIASEILLGY